MGNKYALTVKEAAEYFNIGEKKIRELVHNPECKFVLFVGRKAMIKKDKFTEYLNNTRYI